MGVATGDGEQYVLRGKYVYGGVVDERVTREIQLSIAEGWRRGIGVGYAKNLPLGSVEAASNLNAAFTKLYRKFFLFKSIKLIFSAFFLKP